MKAEEGHPGYDFHQLTPAETASVFSSGKCCLWIFRQGARDGKTFALQRVFSKNFLKFFPEKVLDYTV